MLRISWFLLAIVLLFSCAKITPLEGGDKDVQAPEIDSLKSTPIRQTNFRPKKIKLQFDEWVKLNEVFKNILVSPPLAKQPKVSLKKKTVVFEFDDEEVLRDSTTYTINFGSAIVDITENNPARGLTYVFSTGPEIDSLSVKGKVVDAYTKEPVENVNVMLYDILEDSIVYKEKPYYMAVTDKSGQFNINNLRSGKFKAFAIQDGDHDYRFSQVTEPIGFLEEPILVTDSTPLLTFLLSTELAPIKLKKQDHQSNGIKSLVFNQVPKDISFKPIGIDTFRFLPQGDSIKIWYAGADSTSQLVILSEMKVIDTIELKPKSRLTNFSKIKFQQLGSVPSRVHPKKPLELKMNLPILSWEDSLIVLSKDTLLTKLPISIKIKKDDPTILELYFAWQEKVNYQLNIFPKGIKAINSNLLKDTLTQKINVTPIEKLGNILLVIVPPDSTLQYVVRLMQKKQVVEEVILAPNDRKVTWNLLAPGDYTLELIEDKNNNGIWDSGNYLSRQQPEQVFVRKIDKLRANWDLEVEWNPADTTKDTEKLPGKDEEDGDKPSKE